MLFQMIDFNKDKRRRLISMYCLQEINKLIFENQYHSVSIPANICFFLFGQGLKRHFTFSKTRIFINIFNTCAFDM